MSRTAEKPPPDDAEVDVWWGGHSLRALLPGFLLCVAATLALIALAVYLADVYDLPGDLARYAVYAIGGIFWATQLLRWGLLLVGVNYRLTTRRVYCWTSLRRNPQPPTDLTAVDRVRVEQVWWERFLGIGRVRMTSRDGDLILFGLAQPHRVAALVEQQMQDSRANS